MLISLRRVCLALFFCASLAGAQTLAHPGWRGNGIASEAWWKHSAFIRFGEGTTFAKAAESMDVMSQAGADSLILPDLLPTGTEQQDAAGATHPFGVGFGTEEDLDALLREASARRMHVLLRADLLRLAGNPSELRFWMSRGIAGFDVGDVTSAQLDTLRLFSGTMDRFPGRRILMAHVPDATTAMHRRWDGVTLHLLSQQETSARTGPLQNAVEVHAVDVLRMALPPNTSLVVDAGLLASEQTREDLRRALATRGTHTRTYSGRRSTRRRSR